MDNPTPDERTRANGQLDYDEQTDSPTAPSVPRRPVTNGLNERAVELVRMAEIFLDFDDIVGYKNLALSD